MSASAASAIAVTLPAGAAPEDRDEQGRQDERRQRQLGIRRDRA
jgi:hypothetical protein